MTNVNPSAHPELAEHAAGRGLRAIGADHQVSHETARRRVIEQGTQLIHDLERTLLLAELMRDNGEEQQAQWPGCVIPNQIEPERRAAMATFFWAVDRLRTRGWDIQIITRTTPDGVVFLLTTPGRGDQ